MSPRWLQSRRGDGCLVLLALCFFHIASVKVSRYSPVSRVLLVGSFSVPRVLLVGAFSLKMTLDDESEFKATVKVVELPKRCLLAWFCESAGSFYRWLGRHYSEA
ncbi:hypothetical protein KC19_2G251100 [Ceratodon purpureus]|uniref:Uncharacterized protein n=1 Tax=Ceratodon purpureus TaxID=3225 RepID=A0A8T0IXS5_CERPU|nr:hypothetical protein KC19_2G251100 [Ceratodon purpureus]